MRKSSITLKHFKEVQVHHFLHNSREKPTSNSIFSTEKNYTNVDGRSAIKNFWKEFSIRSKKYTEKTNKKLPKNTIKHISGIFNINENTTKKQIENVIKYLEKSLDTKVIQYSIHKDEGHIDENGNKKINYHVHLEMIGLDSEGRSVRKKITRQYLRNLQTEVAKILGMERGQDIRKTKRKRLDTYQYKRHKKLSDEETKKLKEQLKQKENVIEQLKNEKKQLENEVSNLKSEKKVLQKENLDLKKELKYRKEKLKTLRQILILINKKVNLYTKEDYKKISNIKKEIKNITKNKLIKNIDESIDELVEHYINIIREAVDNINILQNEIQQLHKLKTNNKKLNKKYRLM